MSGGETNKQSLSVSSSSLCWLEANKEKENPMQQHLFDVLHYRISSFRRVPHLAHGENFAVGGRRRRADGSHWHGEEGVRRVSYIRLTANTFSVCYSWHTAK